MSRVMAAFADLGYFPGSNKPRVRHTNRKVDSPPKPQRSEEWDASPRVYPINGVNTEFFTVGQLAKALGREAVTVRKWEREQYLPKATYNVPSPDPRGRRRLYSRAQVVGIVRIASEEGVLENVNRPIRDTNFTERVLELFRELATRERTA